MGSLEKNVQRGASGACFCSWCVCQACQVWGSHSPNSGSELSRCKVAYAVILESTEGSKRRRSEDQGLVFTMNGNTSESLQYKSENGISVTCKRVCVERIEAVVGVDGAMVHVTKEIDGGEEELHERRREFVGEEKEDGGTPKEATHPGAAGLLTGTSDDAR